jgi:hypothetical protein
VYRCILLICIPEMVQEHCVWGHEMNPVSWMYDTWEYVLQVEFREYTSYISIAMYMCGPIPLNLYRIYVKHVYSRGMCGVGQSWDIPFNWSLVYPGWRGTWTSVRTCITGYMLGMLVPGCVLCVCMSGSV